MKLSAKHKLALYKTAAAECFLPDGPKLTRELARESWGEFGRTIAERLDVLNELAAKGLVILDEQGRWRLTQAGRDAINYVPMSKDPNPEVRR